MSVKLNTENVYGQALSAAQPGAKNSGQGEEFEKLLWKMSQTQDELVMSTGQRPQGQKPAQTERPQKPQEKIAADNTQKTEAKGQESQKIQNQAQNQQSLQKPGAYGQETEEAVEILELAALLAVQPVQLNVEAVQETASVAQAANVAEGFGEALAGEALVGYQPVVEQQVMPEQAQGSQTAADTAAQPEAGSLLGQFGQQTAAEKQTSAEAKPVETEILGETAVAQGDEKTEQLLDGEESQIFGEARTVPFKVAELKQPEAAVQPEAANAPEQLAQHIQQALLNGESAVRVNLNPANLGSLTVEIARLSDGTLSIVLSAATEKAASLLEKHSGSLQNLLMNSNQGQVRVEVENRMSEQPTQQFLNPEGEREQQGQQRQEQRQKEQEASAEDFLQQLRLGLISLEQVG